MTETPPNPSRNDWLPAACRGLTALRRPDGSWGYTRGGPGCPEPTALAALALLAAPAGCADREAARRASDWLRRAQRPDGSVGVTPGPDTPGWTTAYAPLVWAALGEHTEPSRRAAGWLLARKGKTVPASADPGRVAGHDTTLVGWPWVDATHSWLEPTALAVLGLSRSGLGGHPRVREGLDLIRNRAVEGGGWNYGNRSVFGRSLRPQPMPTGLALLALAVAGARSATVGRGLRYLARVLPGVRAAASLGWGLLGLRAWGEEPEGADTWLAAAHDALAGRADAATRLAPLVLAAAGGSLALFLGDRSGDAR